MYYCCTLTFWMKEIKSTVLGYINFGKPIIKRKFWQSQLLFFPKCNPFPFILSTWHFGLMGTTGKVLDCQLLLRVKVLLLLV